MKIKNRLSCLCLLTLLLAGCFGPQATQPLGTPAYIVPGTNAPTVPAAAAAGDATTKVVTAAQSFLTTLDEAKRSKVSFAFNDAAQKVKWSNFPTGIFQRAGLRMGDLTQAQRDAALGILAATLSPQGYQKVIDIMNADEALKSTDGGGRLVFGKDEYWISLLGTPSPTTPWMWQFGGHHLALNATIVGKNMVLTPSLPGVQPAAYTINGKTVRPLAAETDAAFKLINTLDAAQQKQAIRGAQAIDLVLGPGQDGKVLPPEGIKADALTPDQQTLLLDLAGVYVHLLNDEAAAVKLAEVKAHLADTYLAWWGPTQAGSAAYFRITGPTLFIEYAPQKMGGDATNHIHAMYRDPTNDYGAGLVK